MVGKVKATSPGNEVEAKDLGLWTVNVGTGLDSSPRVVVKIFTFIMGCRQMLHSMRMNLLLNYYYYQSPSYHDQKLNSVRRFLLLYLLSKLNPS